MDKTNAVVAVFEHHHGADKAVRKLAESGFPINKLNVIGKGFHTEEKVTGFYNMGDRVKLWGKFGVFWGGLWGLLGGGLFMTIPLVGPLVVLGHIAAMLLSVVEGAVVVGGLSALGAAFYSFGIPRDSIVAYEEAIKADGFIVLVEGTAAEVEQARAILSASGAKQVETHCCQGKSMSECAA